MKFFFRHKDDTYPGRKDKEYAISQTGRDFLWLETNDASLKFRLSEEQEQMLDEMTTFLDISLSDLVRQILFVHLYGRYDLLGLLEQKMPSLEEGRVIAYAPPEEPTARIGNTADIKVFLPRVMKDDLTFLAKNEGMTLSKYVRTVVVTHLTGHPALAENSLVNHPLRSSLKKQRPE
jgi:predicted DNA-binding protein